MSDILIEILTEEIPAHSVNPIEDYLKEIFEASLKNQKVAYDEILSYSTPRRFAVIIKNAADTAEVYDKELLGPPKKICFKDDSPTKALLGFAEKAGLDIKHIKFKDTGKVEKAYCILKEGGGKTEDIISGILKGFIENAPLPKRMKWDSSPISFLRPVRNVLMVKDGGKINWSYHNLKSADYTMSNRAAPGKISGVNADNYIQKLRENNVLADFRERKSFLLKAISEFEKQSESSVLKEDAIINEIVNLTEYPVLIPCGFKEEYLKIPKSVLVVSMKKHQRFLPVYKDEKLTNKFIGVSNLINTPYVREGYEKVIDARFADAKFFYENDSSKKFGMFTEKLKKVSFHNKLGSYYDKLQRINFIAFYLNGALNLNVPAGKLEETAHLLKNDLVTEIVFEFPELQGNIGKHYALMSGFDKDAAVAVEEHYKPQSQTDFVPSAPLSVLCALGDKFDNLFSGFYAGLAPTGNKDAFALRRAAIGVIKIIIENKLFFNFNLLADEYFKNFFKGYKGINEIKEFLKQRFVNLIEFEFDEKESVVSVDFSDIYEAYMKITHLSEVKNEVFFKDAAISLKRALNITKDFKGAEKVDEKIFNEWEKTLYERFVKLESQALPLLEKRDYINYLKTLCPLKSYIDAFFDNVFVMDKDEKIKNNRLTLLKKISEAFLKVADLTLLYEEK